MTANPASRIVTPAITTPETQRAIPFLGQRHRVRVPGQDTGVSRLTEIAAAHGIDILGPRPAL
jgi:hypothetical protein